MILLAIIALSGVVLAILYTVLVGLPDFPDEVTQYVELAADYMREGTSFVLSFVYPAPIAVMLGITVTAYTVYTSYKAVMWVVKKIPMFGVSD